MKKTGKVLAAALAFVLVLACLSACGSKSNENAGAGDKGSANAAVSQSPYQDGTQTVTINLIGNDVIAEVTIDGNKFEAKYSFNGNDVDALGTIEPNGIMTVDSYTPESVPDQYVQGALDLIAEALQ